MIKLKEYCINSTLNFIEKYSPNFNQSKRNIVKYGLESFFLSITKIIPILIIALIIGIIKETIMFIIFYNILRFFAFGIHASKSYICLISSTIIFIILPYLSKFIYFNIYFKIFISIFSLISFVLYSPADTHKKPLVNEKKRLILKILSTSILIVYIFLIFCLNNNFYINVLILSMLLESLMINNYVYILFGLPYNNYKTYKKKFN